MSRAPQVVVLGGQNGAGKSTVAPDLLRNALGLKELVNADQIASGQSAFNTRVAVFGVRLTIYPGGEVAISAGTGRERASVKRATRTDAVERAMAEAVERARRQAAAEGLLVPVQRLSERSVRWIKPQHPPTRHSATLAAKG